MAYNRRSSRKGVYRKPWLIRSRKRWIGTAVAAANVLVTPGPATLTLTTYAPTVLTPRVVTPGTAALTITTYAPTVSTPRLVTPGTASLTITTYAPTVLTPRVVTPGTAALTITTYAPTVSTPRLVTPGTASLTLTTYAPTVLTPRLVTPGTAALIITTYAPTVTAGASVSVVPGTATLTLTTYPPTVTVSEPVVTGTVVTLVGVPSLKPRKRAQVTEISGTGLVRAFGSGKLTGAAALAGELLQPNEGSGSLVYDGLRLLIGVIPAGAESVVGGEMAMIALPAIRCEGYGRGVAESEVSGVLAVASQIAGQAWADTPVGGRMPIRSGGEAVAVLEENDEQAALWLLGLPSEIEA